MDSKDRSRTLAYRHTTDFLAFIVEKVDEYDIAVRELELIRRIADILRAGTYPAMSTYLKFRVERRLNQSLSYRSITLDQSGLYLNSGLTEPDYGSEQVTIYSDEDSTDALDDQSANIFFEEFGDLLGFADRVIIVEEEEVEDLEEEEEDDMFAAAESYTRNEIRTLLKSVISDFKSVGFTGSDLVVLSKLYMLLESPGKYRIRGYLSVIFKNIDSNGDGYYNEILYDTDGLSLTSGGFATGEYGGDSYSQVVFPFDDEDEAINAVQLIDIFVNSIGHQISDPHNLELEATDSGDEIQENY